ncbi:MAG: hypothetical protein H0T56_06505 [Pseudaminobacter sp.]|nr:hypothetical protein [Pseudaminobacter sp.]
MGASAYLNLLLNGWETASKAHFVTMLFAAGGASAFAPGFLLARLLHGKRGVEASFAAAFLSFAVTTVGATAAFYALHYRFYYAQWHAEAFTMTWMFQFAFTALAALYQFAVLGLRLFFPFGFIALFGVALWFARRPR